MSALLSSYVNPHSKIYFMQFPPTRLVTSRFQLSFILTLTLRKCVGSVGLIVKLSLAEWLIVVLLDLADSDFYTASNLTVHLQSM